MTDTIIFSVPGGPLGRIIGTLVIKPHLHRFLLARNRYLKKVAESSWAESQPVNYE